VHVRPSNYGRRKLASAPPPEISAAYSGAAQEQGDHPGLRRLIFIYFWLLILEGAVRKWILPGLANPLLIIRDPVVLLIYLGAISRGIFPMNGFVITCVVLAVGNSFAALFVGQDNILVTLYGLRTSFLHIPLIFIMPAVLTRADVEKIGSWILITAIPMALLVLMQFRASPNAWINNGVGASEGAQLNVGFGKIRPPGTFSFTNGLALYLGLLAAFLLSFQLKKWQLSHRIALAAILSLGAMTAVSGSRGVLVSVVIIAAAMVYACLRNSAFIGAGIRTAVLIVVVCSALLLRHEFRLGVEIHSTRIETGGGVEKGLIERTTSGFLEPFAILSDVPILGQGIGLGTTAGAGLIYGGERRFLIAEGEWLRVIRESGPVLGFAYLAMRVGIVLLLIVGANRAIADDNPLPVLLCAAISPVVLSGQFGVPTILGFAVFGAGLCLAAGNAVQGANVPSLFRIGAESVTNPLRSVRGRSIYAEKLHGR